VYALVNADKIIIALTTTLISFNPQNSGRNLGKTNQAKSNQATKGAPLIVSI
jgi:hypothetical protein